MNPISLATNLEIFFSSRLRVPERQSARREASALKFHAARYLRRPSPPKERRLLGRHLRLLLIRCASLASKECSQQGNNNNFRENPLGPYDCAGPSLQLRATRQVVQLSLASQHPSSAEQHFQEAKGNRLMDKTRSVSLPSPPPPTTPHPVPSERSGSRPQVRKPATNFHSAAK